MPAMSGIERAFCDSRLWQLTSGPVTRSLPLDGLSGTVLEVGAGAGAVAERIAGENPDVSFSVVDIDPKMVASARERLAGVPNVVVEQADATALPFADASFDAVLSCLMLHHVIEWEAALAEVKRVLKPGGRLIGYDLTRTLANQVIHKLDGSPHRLVAPAELSQACAGLGFGLDLRIRLARQAMTFVAARTN